MKQTTQQTENKIKALDWWSKQQNKAWLCRAYFPKETPLTLSDSEITKIYISENNTENKSTRELAIEWWNGLKVISEKVALLNKYGYNNKRTCASINGDEITAIYIAEHPAKQAQINGSDNLTKERAIGEMLRGNKVTHQYFTNNEWTKLNGMHEIEFEDGCKIDVETFWKDRQGEAWETGWSIYKAPPTKEVSTVGYTQGEWGLYYPTVNEESELHNHFTICPKGDPFVIAKIPVNDNLFESEANAQRIVTAVNNHDALVSALKELVDKIDAHVFTSEVYAYRKEITTAKALLTSIKQ